MLTVKLNDGTIVGKRIVETLKSWGYTINYGVQNAVDFSTPQNRRRAVILASKIGVWNLPLPHERQITLREAIGDLPSLEVGQDSGIKYHVAPSWDSAQVEVMKHTPTGCSAHDNLVWKPVNVDAPPKQGKI